MPLPVLSCFTYPIPERCFFHSVCTDLTILYMHFLVASPYRINIADGFAHFLNGLLLLHHQNSWLMMRLLQ